MNSAKTLYVNVPTKNLSEAKDFYSKLGFGIDARYTSDNSACMVICENIFLMLLSESHFGMFSPKPLSDATTSAGVLLCLLCDSREQVNDLVSRAIDGGGSTYDQAQDLGFMYSHGFQDLDGYVWKLNYMYPAEQEK